MKSAKPLWALSDIPLSSSHAGDLHVQSHVLTEACAQGQGLVCIKHSLMTAVPLPGVTWPVRHEVSSPFVLHPLWEPQQDPYIIIGGLGAIGRAGSGQKKGCCLFLINETRKEKRKEARKGSKAGTYLENNLPLKTTSPNNAVLTGRVIHFVWKKEKKKKKKKIHLFFGRANCCWRAKLFILWLVLTMGCWANYTHPSASDCRKLRLDMKAL